MEEVLTIGEAAELCSVAPSTVQYWERKGLLSAFKTLGGHRRFKRADILGLLEKRGRKLTATVSREILYQTKGPERRVSSRLEMGYPVRVELTDGLPESKLVCNGRLLNVSKSGFGVIIYGLDFNLGTLKKILNKFHTVKVWPPEDVGYLKNPLEGTIVHTQIDKEEIRIGSIFKN